MATDPSHRVSRQPALDVFVGEWTEQVHVPDVPPGRVVFEWALEGTYLIQRSDIPKPEFLDSIAIIADAAQSHGGAYTFHYFDSRGTVRIYRMGLHGGVWTLQRTEPDFSPLDFWQRFEGRFSADGDTIDARWEASRDAGEHWELDFRLTYTRVG